MNSQQQSQELFARQGHLLVQSLLGDPLLTITYFYTLKMLELGNFYCRGEANAWPDTKAAYGNLSMDSILDVLRPHFEQGVGLELSQSYSYVRVYENDDRLLRHTDREAGEISVTIPLGQKPADPWPIMFEHGGKSHEINLSPGDALIYRGCDHYHWRKPYTGEHYSVLTLHYVDKNGAYTDHALDAVHERAHGFYYDDIPAKISLED